MGNVVQAGAGQAPARQASLAGGLPASSGATTINKVCGSGLKAVMLAAAAIRAGDGDLYVAGGMESMNRAPYLLPGARFGYRLGNAGLVDALINDGLWCAFENQHMGLSAEWMAAACHSRGEDQDGFALLSHQRALAALDRGSFRAEIVPVPMPQRKGPPILCEVDENPRRDTSLAALAVLRPAFTEDGTVTAGNAPGITDGAAALVVARRVLAEKAGRPPSGSDSRLRPGRGEASRRSFTAPIYAVRKLAASCAHSSGFDLYEINEAFASQCLGDVARSWGWIR